MFTVTSLLPWVRPFFQGISLRIIMFHHLSSVAIASAREDKVMLSSNFSSCHLEARKRKRKRP